MLGIDGFQPYKWKVHSITVVFLKCLDFADRYQGGGSNIFPLMLIEGPQEPSDMTVYLRIIADEFKQLGPNG